MIRERAESVAIVAFNCAAVYNPLAMVAARQAINPREKLWRERKETRHGKKRRIEREERIKLKTVHH
jgi:hypothetical protein